MRDDFCNCREKFRTAEDYRDHLPCPGPKCCLKTKKEFAEKVASYLCTVFNDNGYHKMGILGEALAKEIMELVYK